jgi:von Willebrand factor type A domain/Bacterial TSP3 repeat
MKVRLLMFLSLNALTSACTDVFLEPKQVAQTNLDDTLTISGRVCTARPDPSGFPVKVVLVVDQSGSMCISDPPGSQESVGFCEMYGTVPPGVTQPARVRALNRLLDQFQTQPNVQVALVPFETNVPPERVWPQIQNSMSSRFGRPADVRTNVNTLQSELGKGTDYQGALAYAYGLIATDINQVKTTNPALLPRTRYVVVFLTDGVPFPKCAANDNLTQYADDLNPQYTWADSFGAGDFCNLIDPDSPDAITGFVAGTDRNQNYQLFSYVDQLLELKNQYNVGDLRLHTVLLFNEQAVRNCGPICQDIYGQYVRWPGPVPFPDGPRAAKSIARWTLQQLAQRGNGVYQEFNDFAGIAQLNLGALDYSSLASKNVMKSLYIQSLTSEPGLKNRELDTDGDGLIDTLDNDFTNQTNPFFADSDGDGFSDDFEVQNKTDGFRSSLKDSRGCDENYNKMCTVRDTDGDGLSQWAEDYLKTSTTLVDFDTDSIPDGFEVKYGLDPLKRNEAGLDTDGDGVSDVDEFKAGSNPVRRDLEYQAKHSIQYDVKAEPQANGSICYDFTATNLQLVTPPNQAGQRQGFNLHKVWFAEAPESGVASDYGVWKTACVWSQFAPPALRVPAGQDAPKLSNANFRPPGTLLTNSEYNTNCVGINPVNGQSVP